MPNVITCEACNQALDVSAFAARQIITCGYCGKALAVPGEPEIAQSTLVSAPTSEFTFIDTQEAVVSRQTTHRLRTVFAVVVPAAIILAVVIVVPGAWYAYHRYDVAEQDACAERYLKTFWKMFDEPKPSIHLNSDVLDFKSPPHVLEAKRIARRAEREAAESEYHARIAKHQKKMNAIEDEIQRRWGMGRREFVFRYFERHPWLDRTDPAEFANLMSIGRF